MCCVALYGKNMKISPLSFAVKNRNNINFKSDKKPLDSFVSMPYSLHVGDSFYKNPNVPQFDDKIRSTFNSLFSAVAESIEEDSLEAIEKIKQDEGEDSIPDLENKVREFFTKRYYIFPMLDIASVAIPLIQDFPDLRSF